MIMDGTRREEKDLVSGQTVCHEESRTWTQRLIESYALCFLTAGACDISIDKATSHIEAGDLVLLHPGIRHTFHIPRGADLLWVHFLPRSHVMSMLKWPEDSPGLSRVHLGHEEAASIKRELREVDRLRKEHLTGWYMLASALLEASLARGYRRALNHSGRINRYIQTAQELLVKSAAPIDAVAAACGVSRATLYSTFKRATGLSPLQYRETTRMREAMLLLESSSLPVAEIAKQVGISDAFYFSTRFRKFHGESPRQYRQKFEPPT
jgi:AraC family transcriptional regulator of arabinose operon